MIRPALAVLLASAAVVFALGGMAGHPWEIDASWTTAAAFAVLGVATARSRASTGDRRAWNYLLAGTGCWVAGQLAWDLRSLAGGALFPGPADVGWLAFPVLASIGLYRFVPLDPQARRVARLETLPIMVAVATVLWALLQSSAAASHLALEAKLLALTYPALYLILPVVMLQALIAGRLPVRANPDLMLVLFGLAVEALAFVLYARLLLDQSYVTGDTPLDALWTIGMLAIGAGGFMHRGRTTARSPGKAQAGLLPALTFVVVLVTLIVAGIAGAPLAVRLPLQLGVLAIGVALLTRSVLLEREARRARATSARFFELSRDLLCTATMDGRFVEVNPAWLETLGYRSEDLVGRPLLELVHPDDVEPTIALMGKVQRKEVDTEHIHHRLIAKDGSERWISWSTRADFESGLVYARGADSTERRAAADSLARTNEELALANEELARSNKELEQFAYVASHDLAEPLRSISGFSQFLATEYEDKLDDDGREYLGHIISGTVRMRTLIDALLEYSRVGRSPAQKVAVPGDEILDDVLSSLDAAIRDSGATVTREPLPVVLADRGELARVFQNLLSNALKFAGEDAPRVHIAATPDGDRMLFSVTDNGIGVEPEFAERVFGMFKRLHHRDRYPGAGIGLTVSRRIVERHGGRIWVETAATGGSCFKFTLKNPTETA
jgi:PAS domain S-box-containing protein